MVKFKIFSLPCNTDYAVSYNDSIRKLSFPNLNVLRGVINYE